jgi:hypothetical protein
MDCQRSAGKKKYQVQKKVTKINSAMMYLPTTFFLPESITSLEDSVSPLTIISATDD